MLKYKIGDCVIVNTETPPNKQKRILTREPTPDTLLGSGSYQVVAKDELMKTYKIILDDDMLGWQISMFHIQHERVPVAFQGKKFYDVQETFVLGKHK